MSFCHSKHKENPSRYRHCRSYEFVSSSFTNRVSLLSLSDKSTGDVLGHVGDVRRGLRHWVFLFVELHVEGPHSAFYGWWTLVGWSGMRHMLLYDHDYGG